MIIVETGSGLPNANSYVREDEFRDFATERGVSLPESESEVEALLHRAMDYLETLTFRFSGRKKSPTQRLAFPRMMRDPSVFYYKDIDVGVPDEVKKAQMVAALAAKDGPILGSTSISSSAMATRKTVGPITVEYAEGGRASNPVAYIPHIHTLLRRFMYGNGQPTVVRG